MVIALNMYDELEHSGASFDHEALGKMIGVPMIPVVAPASQGIEQLLDAVIAKTGCDVQLHAFEDKDAMKAAIAESDILANATNVGMGDGCTDTPVPAEFIKEGMVVADAIYFPLMTQLLQNAEAKGCKVITGIGMMNEQAAVGEKIWYGVDMPIDEVTAELNA
jgi:shikimate dehydrogenase